MKRGGARQSHRHANKKEKGESRPSLFPETLSEDILSCASFVGDHTAAAVRGGEETNGGRGEYADSFHHHKHCEFHVWLVGFQFVPPLSPRLVMATPYV